MTISIIAAIDKNNCIGSNNALPWSLPADMKRFKTLTKGKPIIMGSKTFESIGIALPHRDNIILTRNKDYIAPDCKITNSIEQALDIARKSEMIKNTGEIMICGGASIYKQFLTMAHKMYLTFIDHSFDGDAYFPEFSKDEWREIEKEICKADDVNQYNYSFVTLEKNICH